MVTPERRPAAFAQNRVSAIIGLGLGGLVGGFIAAAGLDGYVRLLQLDAITFLLFACVVLLLPSAKEPARTALGGGYITVLRDRAFVRLLAINCALVSAGIAPMLWLLAPYAKGQAHVPVQAVGAIYAVNTLVIVVMQLPLTRAARTRNPLAVIRVTAFAWVSSWIAILVAGASASGTTAAVVIACAVAGYAAGECLYTAVMTPTAVSLAPEHLRGRYLGAMGLAWQSGFLLGPSAGSAILAWHPLALPAVGAAVCLVIALSTR